MALEYIIFIGMGVAVIGSAIVIGVLQNKKKRSTTITDKPIELPPVKPIDPWPDRRPIGMIMIAEYAGEWQKDDRKWKVQGAYQHSYEAFIAHAKESIQHMREVGAQGMILWNCEGEQWWKPISYIGDPSFIGPEFDPYANEFFQMFKDAGFSVGVCIRPDKYVPLKENTWAHHLAVASHFENLIPKIDYARERWGCTLFYVDSNKVAEPGTDNTVGHGNPCSVEVFIELKKLYPDCLFIPEHWRPEYFPHVPIWAKGAHIEPGAVVAGEVSGEMEVEEFIKAGNIPVLEVWWKTAVQDKIKQAYATD